MESGKLALATMGNAGESLAPAALKSSVDWSRGIKTPKTKESSDWERRSGLGDRRISGVPQRLRKGLWFEYHRITEVGQFDIFPLSLRSRDNLLAALVREGRRYQFSDRTSGGALDVSSIAASTIDYIWGKYSNVPDLERQAVFIIEEAASFLSLHYNVKLADHRKANTSAGT